MGNRVLDGITADYQLAPSKTPLLLPVLPKSLSLLLVLPDQPLIKIRFDHAEGRRADIQQETVEFHVRVTAAKGLLSLALHVDDFQVAHIILQVVGRILCNEIGRAHV